jgi:hypothetical protein
MDHVIPWAQGGADRLTNLVPACGSCNNRKNDKTPVDWWIATFMRGHWDGEGTVHEGAKWGEESISLRELYLHRHEEALAVLDNVERALAEIADQRRRDWFIWSTSVDYPTSFMDVHFHRGWCSSAIEKGKAAGWPDMTPEHLRRE